MPDLISPIKAALFGLATGDALGVPVEFQDREELLADPVTGMRGWGTWNQPPGTWSDDSELAFCLADTIAGGFSAARLADAFQRWLRDGFWTPHGAVFDVGNATRAAIGRLAEGVAPELAGGFKESENGNGSLMRILPLLFLVKDKDPEERYHLTKLVSSVTHAHVRAVIACYYYLEFARGLLAGKKKESIYAELQKDLPAFLRGLSVPDPELALFGRLLEGDISSLPASAVRGSGYVLQSLEASVWCLMTTDSYEQAVLKAVNLGEDTDTTGAITGGLAGLLYGYGAIPAGWMAALARKADIDELAARLNTGLQQA
ncbi:MAG: ADP-ribosylglycohydrolase family protein [Chitinophagaceae bacterium]|nr:MAG: ADP-ribosylglycohydrolase family protein [Chitinophagaceae bacterium]